MAEVVLMHHAQGLTEGVVAFADRLRAAGHVVHVPDLFEGRTFATVAEGVAHAQAVGFDEVRARGGRAVEGLPERLVYAGMSLGAMPAQQLAQQRPGALAAVLLHACVPTDSFGPWPDGVALQVHVMEGDELGDVDVAQEVVPQVPGGELHLYPGSDHLFTDSSLDVYDAGATALVEERVLALLERLDGDRAGSTA